jgi:hypothetical protein
VIPAIRHLASLVAFLTLSAALLAAPPAFGAGAVSVTPDRGMPEVNGPVKALATGPDGTVYIGGTFTYIGPRTGAGVVVAPVTARRYTRFADALADNGDGIRSVISDGHGGFYVGGSFWIDEHYRQYRGLAHLRSDGSWDTRFRDPGYDADCLAISGRTLFVGGRSTSVGGRRRYHVAAFDAVTGALQKWDAHLTGGSVTSLTLSGKTLFVGGSFSASIGGHLRRALAAFDARTGRLLPWDAAFARGTEVRTLAVSGSRLYVGGLTREQLDGGSVSRPLLRAMDVHTGAPSDWDPFRASDPPTIGSVSALAVSGATVYLGGFFDAVGGQARRSLAAVDVDSGLATAWDPAAPALSTGAAVSSLIVLDDAVYVAGSFTSLGGRARNGVAALDATTGLATAWDMGDPMSTWRGRPPYDARFAGDGYVHVLGQSASMIFVGGDFSYIGGERRRNLAAIGPDGRLSDWSPSPDWAVRALAVAGDVVYAGGSFRHVDSERRDYIAALDGSTGELLPWDPSADDDVYALAVSNSLVYAGGRFTRIGGSTREHLAAIGGDGQATSWDPGATGGATPAEQGVRAIVATPSRIYIGGAFSAVGGQRHDNLAAIDATSGLATSWDTGADDVVRTLALSGSRLYVGGDFARLGGKARSRIGAVDAASGLPTPWDPRAAGPGADVRSLTILDRTLYAGGRFTAMGGYPRKHVAAIDADRGAVTPWRTQWGIGSIDALAADGARLWMGESARSTAFSPKPYLARFSAGGR